MPLGGHRGAGGANRIVILPIPSSML